MHDKGGDQTLAQYLYPKLAGKIVEKYGTRKRFAEEIGLSENSISLKMNGKTGFSQEDMVQWGDLLDIETVDYGLYFFPQKLQ